MDQINKIMFNNKSKEKINIDEFFPLLFPEYSPENIIQDPCQNSFNNNNIINENILLPIENIKNIFQKESLDLNESDEEDTKMSLYFIKKQDNLETESRSTESSTNVILFNQKYIENKKETTILKKNKFQTFLKKISHINSLKE